MSLFDMTEENRRQYVAALLGCKPTDRSGRLNETIDQLLKNAEHAAEDKLRLDIMRMVGLGV